MLAPSSSTVRSSRSASNAPPALSPRDTLADSLVSGRENASTTDAGSREYRICRNCGSNAAVGAEKLAGVSCVNVSTPESRSTVPASHAIGSAHMAQRLSPIDAMSRMQTVSSTTVLPHERPVNTVFCRKMLMPGDGCKQRKQRGQGEHPLCRSRMPNTVGQPCCSDTDQCTGPYTRVQRRTRSARRREDTVIRSSAAG